MSNERDKQFNPLVSPDAARKTFQLLERFYDGYAKRNNGYVDADGLQYVGTFENWGSEIYSEARKLLTDRVPIDLVFTRNEFDFYFNLMYSELIETYEQQTMFVGVLKENVLRSNCTYKLRFTNCNMVNVLRAESWSDPNVKRDPFIITTTAPTLSIVDPDNQLTEVDLTISSNVGGSITYAFHPDYSNTKPSTPEHPVEQIWNYDETTQTLIIDLTKREVNRPWIWVYCDAFKTLPDIGFVNNEDVNGNTLLTVGTDGHANSYLYPCIYENNVPAILGPDEDKQWFLKIIPVDTSEFVETGDTNAYSIKVKEVSYVYSTKPWDQPDYIKTVKFESTDIKVTLTNVDNIWIHYRKPQPGDYDYDGIRYINRRYAWISLNEYEDQPTSTVLKHLLKIDFLKEYLHTFEHMMGNAVSGVHMDTCSDRSDNGVLKKNGTIHSLGDFDGLPIYFKLLGDHCDHRSHVELYAIRDQLNKYNQKATDKQTAAIIIDSALSPKDSEEMLDTLPILIKYNFDVGREYAPVSGDVPAVNVKSSITFIDENTFGDDATLGQEVLPHFIYQGGRVYSLTSFRLDPDLEYGRVYIITNDPSEYENNMKTQFTKAARTFARICDIPTTFSQLIHVTGFVPTVIIDKKYIHCDAAFLNDDNERLWNYLYYMWAEIGHQVSDASGHQIPTNVGIFSYGSNLDLVFRTTGGIYHGSRYTRKKNLNPTIMSVEISKTASSSGRGYAVNDKFTFYVGGRLISGVVDSVYNGGVNGFTLDISDSEVINVANLDGRLSYFETETVMGQGTGLIISFEITSSRWEEINDHDTSEAFDNLFTMKFDRYGFLWFWDYDPETEHWSESSQLTGPIVNPNPYDTKYGISEINTRSMCDVYLYNMLVPYRYAVNHNVSEKSEISVVPTSVDKDTVITFTGPNYQNTLYALSRYDDSTYNNYKVTYWTSTSNYDNRRDVLKFPQYNQVNLDKYTRIGSSIQPVNRSVHMPVMGYYNPKKNVIVELNYIDKISADIEETPKTFLNSINPEFITKNGYLKESIFEYNEFKMTNAYKEMWLSINSMTRPGLIMYVKQNYPDADWLDFEDTEYAYDEERIRAYIMSNWWNNPIYKRDDISILRHINEQVVTEEGEPLGEQPTGGYEYLIETHKPNVEFDGDTYITDITNIFKIDENVDLTGFIIKNDNGTDVSKNSLILMRGKIYAYIGDQWVKVN